MPLFERPDADPEDIVGTDAATRALSVAVVENIQKGEVCDLKLEPAEALKFYLPCEKSQPQNAHLLACIARQYSANLSGFSSTTRCSAVMRVQPSRF